MLALGFSVAMSVSAVVPGFAATTLAWKGQTWEVMAPTGGATGTAALDGSGNAVITRTSGIGDMALHLNRVEPAPGGTSAINAIGTPWIQVSYLDNGQSRGVDFFIDDETMALDPRLQAGSLFDCQGLGYARFAADTEQIVFGQGVGCNDPAPGIGARASGQAHTIYVGERPDGTVDYNYDGLWFTSSFLKDNVGHFSFNDVYLRLRGNAGTSATFTDFRAGNDHRSPLTNKDNCKKDGWKAFRNGDGSAMFKNQGDCVSYTNNGK
jgi:hypothetical protein